MTRDIFFKGFLIILFASIQIIMPVVGIWESKTKPDLLLIITAYMGFRYGIMSGQLTGFVVGVFIDALSANPLGTGMLSFTIIGFITGLLHKKIYHEGIVSAFIILIIVTVAKGILIVAVSVIFTPYPLDIANYFKYYIIYEMFFNSLLGALIFPLLKRIDVRLRRVFA